MKTSTAVLGVILALMLVFCALFYFGGTLQVQSGCIVAPASDYESAFDRVREVLLSGTAAQVFSADPLDDPANFSLVDISATLTNRGLFDAEWLNISVEEVNGDVAVYSLTGNGDDIPARSGGSIDLKIVTRAAADAKRTVTVQYYVYGISRSVKFTVW